MRNQVSLKRLKELLHYNQKTGIFTNRINVERCRTKGKRAGFVAKDSGYRFVAIDDIDYREHRLAWFYVHGKWPSQTIDHKNNKRDDNRFANLRDVSLSVNGSNRSGPTRANKLGIIGVHIGRPGKFLAKITVNKKEIHIGTFLSAKSAVRAYRVARRSHGLYDKYGRTGKGYTR